MQEFLGLFLFMAGFVIGLGALTVIDLHGFLGRKSKYWTEATTRTHKITKPLIWSGVGLAILGAALYYGAIGPNQITKFHAVIAIVLILNGCFLSFNVSPYLLKREKEGQASELLPPSWQRQITLSFIISFLGWWIALALLAWQITMQV